MYIILFNIDPYGLIFHQNITFNYDIPIENNEKKTLNFDSTNLKIQQVLGIY